MYIYFDKQGKIIKELELVPFRVGNSKANTITIYINTNKRITQCSIMFKFNDGSSTPELFMNSTSFVLNKKTLNIGERTTITPFIEGKVYDTNAFSYTLEDTLLVKGKASATIRAFDLSGSIITQGIIDFNIEDAIIQRTIPLTLEQYNELLNELSKKVSWGVNGNELGLTTEQLTTSGEKTVLDYLYKILADKVNDSFLIDITRLQLVSYDEFNGLWNRNNNKVNIILLEGNRYYIVNNIEKIDKGFKFTSVYFNENELHKIIVYIYTDASRNYCEKNPYCDYILIEWNSTKNYFDDIYNFGSINGLNILLKKDDDYFYYSDIREETGRYTIYFNKHSADNKLTTYKVTIAKDSYSSNYEEIIHTIIDEDTLNIKLNNYLIKNDLGTEVSEIFFTSDYLRALIPNTLYTIKFGNDVVIDNKFISPLLKKDIVYSVMLTEIPATNIEYSISSGSTNIIRIKYALNFINDGCISRIYIGDNFTPYLNITYKKAVTSEDLAIKNFDVTDYLNKEILGNEQLEDDYESLNEIWQIFTNEIENETLVPLLKSSTYINIYSVTEDDNENTLFNRFTFNSLTRNNTSIILTFCDEVYRYILTFSKEGTIHYLLETEQIIPNLDWGNIVNRPTKLSQFENDLGFIDKNVNNLTYYYTKEDVDNKNYITISSVTWANIPDKPFIPSKTSDITNDSGFITSAVNNLANYYTKTEIDNKNYITLQDVTWTNLIGKPTDVSAFNNDAGYITKTINDLTNYYNKTTIDTTLSNYLLITNFKFNNLPDKPTLLSQFTNDSGFITNTVSNLTNYYQKSEVYTKQETDQKIANASFLKVRVENELPEIGVANTIYLVPASSVNVLAATVEDNYDEYLWQDDHYEKLGSVRINLSNYIQTDDTLTADKLIIGNGDKKIKTTSYSIGTTYSNDANIILTGLAIANELTKYALNTSITTLTDQINTLNSSLTDLKSKAVLNSSLGKNESNQIISINSLSLYADTADKALKDKNNRDIYDTYATKEELNTKQPLLVSGENIKKINNQSLLGSGNIDIVSEVDSTLNTTSENPVQNKVITTELNKKADINNVYTKTEIEQIKTQLNTNIDKKQPLLESGQNIKTVNNQSLLGAGNIDITPETGSDVTMNVDNEIGAVRAQNINVNGSVYLFQSIVGQDGTFYSNLKFSDEFIIVTGTPDNLVSIKSISYNKITDKPTIPTNTSQLTNDSGFLTSVSWNDLLNKPTIPSSTSQLLNDSAYITKEVDNLTYYYTKNEIDSKNYLLSSNFLWENIPNKPVIPTKTSDLINDSKFIVSNKVLTNQDLNLLNTEDDIGAYYFAGGGNTVTNKPNGVDAFGLFINRVASGYYSQLIISSNTNSGQIWLRIYQVDSWTEWKRIDFDNSRITWDILSGKPTFSTVATSGSYNDLSNKPTKLSQFENDSGFVTNSTVSVSWNNLLDKPTIPTLISQLTNDSGFITASYLSSYLPLSGGTLTGPLTTSTGATAIGSKGLQSSVVSDAIVNELCKSNGLMGSIALQAHTVIDTYIPEGWYNYIYIPHQNGGESGDNYAYGTLILNDMTTTRKNTFIVVYSGNQIVRAQQLTNNDTPKYTISVDGDTLTIKENY